MSEPLTLPDAYAEPGSDGYTTIVANKKAREVLEKGFDKPGPRWRKVRGSNILKSPEYRCLGIEDRPLPQILLSVIHQAGLMAMFTCTNCDKLHIMDDEQAARFLKEAEFFAVNVHAAPGTLQ